MSSLTVTTIETANNTTDLTLKTGNGSGPEVIVTAGEDIALRANSSIDAYRWDKSANAHIFNASNGSNTAVITRSGANASLKAAGQASASQFQILNAANDGIVTIVGGNTITNGSRITFFGGSHSSQAGDIELRSNNDRIYHYDESSNGHIFADSAAATLFIANTTNIEANNVFVIKKKLQETIDTLSGTVIDANNGTIQQKTLSANVTFTENLSNGDSLLLMIDANDTSATITWPSMQWVGGSAPDLAANGYTCIEVFQAGGTVYGAHIGDMS